jgi:bifunctional ADP-heptose synthase (sugar kinase/adenylyltransferase)
MTVGYLWATFDLLNVSDLDVIEQARERCDRLVVGVRSDEEAAVVHGRRPVVPMGERLTLLSYVRGVDDVVAHGESDGPESADLLFAKQGEVEPDSTVRLLTPRRQTDSAVVRLAVQPLSQDSASTGAVA